MNSLSLKNKLLLLVVVLLIFCTVVGIIGYKSSQKIGHNYQKIEDDNVPNITSLYESLAAIRSARIYLVQLALPNLSSDVIKDMRDRVQKAVGDYDNENNAYTSGVLSDDEKEFYTPVKEAGESLKQDITKALELQAKSEGKEGPSLEGMRKLINGDIVDDNMTYQAAFFKLMDWQRKDIKINSDTAIAASKSGTLWSIISIVGAIVLGGILSFFVLKNIMSDQEKTARAMREAVQNSNMVEKSPINTMMATPDGIFTYMNENSKQTLKKLQQYLPEKVENFMGKSIDILHKNPAAAKRIIKDPKNLPHQAIISVGPEKLSLLIAAIHDGDGTYMGPMVTWEVVTEKVDLVKDLAKASEELAAAAANVQLISSNLSSAAEETAVQINTAGVATEEVNAGMQTVARNMEEMVSAINVITKTTTEAASISSEAMNMAKNANTIINQLGDSSMDIGNVIKVISSIAQQTNLLALNATIEAARAGDAGKGFAVVANEVKELANQTAKATHEITKKIENIQGDSKNAVDAIAEISGAIDKINGYAGNIATSIGDQAATTNEVTRVVTESADGIRQINENINKVSDAAESTGKDAGNANLASTNVNEIASQLKTYVARLKV